MEIHKLTAEFLDAFKPGRIQKPEPGIYGDGDRLWLQVTERGGASWLFRYRLPGGKARAAGLGPLHIVSAKAAREAAQKMRELVHAGVDPLAQGARSRALTFGELCKAYFADNPSHSAQYENMVKTYCKPIAGVMVDKVSAESMVEVFRPIWTAKKETARRLRFTVHKLFEYAARVKKQRPVGDNPADAANLALALGKRGKSNKKMPALDYQRAPAVMKQLRAMTEVPARALEFAILTGCRRGDIVGATKKDAKPKDPLRWSDIDMARAVWIIDRTKNGDPIELPLSPAAMAVLEGQRANFPDSLRVFDIAKDSMLYVLKKIAPVTAHGFRATVKTWCDEEVGPAYRQAIEVQLAHKVTDSTVEGRYRRGQLFKTRRELMNAWAAYLADESNVVPLPLAA